MNPPRDTPILVTGFEPFDGETLNPSWLVAEALHGRRFALRGAVRRGVCTRCGCPAACRSRR